MRDHAASSTNSSPILKQVVHHAQLVIVPKIIQSKLNVQLWKIVTNKSVERVEYD